MEPPESPETPRSKRREREERMRYEVLQMLYRAWTNDPEQAELHAYAVVADLGVWHEELFRVVDFLDRRGYVAYLGAGPLVRITPAGVRYLEEEAGARRSIR